MKPRASQGDTLVITTLDRFGRSTQNMLAGQLQSKGAANHAALAESTFGAGVDVSSMVCVLIDEGIGSGVVIDGHLLRGYRGGAGEIGALDSVGWRLASERLSQSSGGNGLDLLTSVEGRSAATHPALAGFTRDIAHGTAGMVLAFDPEVVVLGGVVARAHETFLDLIRNELAKLCLYSSRLERAAFGENAVVRGAAIHALREVETMILP